MIKSIHRVFSDNRAIFPKEGKLYFLIIPSIDYRRQLHFSLISIRVWKIDKHYITFSYTQDYTIKHYLKMGADPTKLVMGIPTYGRSYTLFNPDANEIGAPADGPGEMGEATRENGYLAYYEVNIHIHC